MIVWVLTRCDLDDTYIEGAFSTQQLATDRAHVVAAEIAANEHMRNDHWSYYIEPYELDKPSDENKSMLVEGTL